MRSYLISLTVDKNPHDLAKETGQQWVEDATSLKEAVEAPKEGLILTQRIVYLCDVRCEDLA